MKKMVFHEHIDWKSESMLYMEIGKRIREARVRKGFTQEELSERVKLSRPSVSYLENGQQNISFHVIYEICFVLKAKIASMTYHSFQAMVRRSCNLIVDEFLYACSWRQSAILMVAIGPVSSRNSFHQ